MFSNASFSGTSVDSSVSQCSDLLSNQQQIKEQNTIVIYRQGMIKSDLLPNFETYDDDHNLTQNHDHARILFEVEAT